MNEFLEQISTLSPKRLALLALELKTQLDAVEQARREPIAVIGMGCRYPGGADSPAAFWRLLRDGVDAIGEVPRSRWDVDALYDPDPDAPGKTATRWGGFLDEIDQFDPHFFGISPREATAMDPQQRLLLEVAWEALEDAGYAPDRLIDSPTGVYIGIFGADYLRLLLAEDEETFDTYTVTGNGHSMAAGRLSYLLGLKGPSLAVDTACSASLVAVHLALQGLRNGECRMAVAGGVNAILSPDTTMMLSRGRTMAPDGRCKAFAAAADGYVRSEGCGLMVLKRLSDALADGDRVLALLRGSAVNQDGRSNGLTAPNGPSQVAVIRAALANAGIEPAEVSYVETHGTGTPLGDPIEAQALVTALGMGRPTDQPLMIGSVKTNLGHLEAAAGIAGLMKVVLSLQHGEIPPHLHLEHPNPHIPWNELPLTIPTRLTPWPAGAARRTAGVSAFGLSGTNAHVIVEEAPAAPARPAARERPLHLLALSARSEAALGTLAARYAEHLAAQPEAAIA
ncbi:MAG TPA: polyketide synthase, partial [Chloroflexota bacterium]|nr:polyketide synthase [Chloroflexota bacterium]